MMNKEQIKALDNLQADLISPEEEATLDPPTHDENRVLRGEHDLKELAQSGLMEHVAIPWLLQASIHV